MNSWERRRSNFCHDYLKGHFIGALHGFISRLGAERPDAKRLREFLTEDLASWPEHQVTAELLIASFQEENSPRALFCHSPLQHCDEQTKQWLPQLAHATWLSQYPVKETLDWANRALHKAANSHERIMSRIDSPANAPICLLKTLMPQFRRLRDACKDLSKALAALHTKIRTYE